jgi:hypothetical protein
MTEEREVFYINSYTDFEKLLEKLGWQYEYGYNTYLTTWETIILDHTTKTIKILYKGDIMWGILKAIEDLEKLGILKIVVIEWDILRTTSTSDISRLFLPRRITVSTKGE